MERIRIPRIMQMTSRKYFLQNRTVGLVPTMGALHEGHLSLVRRARDENDVVVASIFVNPLQFGPGEDLDKYPRDLEGDMEKLERAGADVLFMPDPPSMYPEGFATSVTVAGISEKLCGAFRPGHFTGVATVVLKLLNCVFPTRAYFGQKDYQQTVVIRRTAEDLNLGVELVICPTAREHDGLAMSSRNLYLQPEERRAATVLYRALDAAAHMIRTVTNDAGEVNNHMLFLLKGEPLVSEVQYAGLYDPETLDPVGTADAKTLLAVAVKIGSTRLIDNMLVER